MINELACTIDNNVLGFFDKFLVFGHYDLNFNFVILEWDYMNKDNLQNAWQWLTERYQRSEIVQIY